MVEKEGTTLSLPTTRNGMERTNNNCLESVLKEEASSIVFFLKGHAGLQPRKRNKVRETIQPEEQLACAVK